VGANMISFLFFGISRKDMQEVMMDNDSLSVIKLWLEPLPDGSLPTMEIRKKLLDVLEQVNWLNGNIRRILMIHPIKIIGIFV
jgi:hypothetical protein